MAATGPRAVQSRAVDLHTRARADATILLFGDRVSQRHPDIL